MRIPRVRLSVRRLMVLVAIVALILGGVRASEHYLRCMKIASAFETAMQDQSRMLSSDQRFNESVRKSADRSPEEARRKAAEYEAEARAIRAEDPFNKSAFDAFTSMAATSLDIARSLDESQLQAKQRIVRGKRRVELGEANIRYLSGQREKYLRAALRPWARIPPDPPPPFPDEAAAYWMGRGDLARTLAEYRRAIEIGLDDADTHNAYAWLLATCPDPKHRDGKKAIESATRACEMTEWKDPAMLDTLAAAYAEAGDFDQAVKWQQEAIELVSADSQARAGYLERLELYRAGRPYRDEPEGR